MAATHAELTHETAHVFPQPPQFPFCVSSTHELPQGLKPVSQEIPQDVPSHVAVPFAGTSQGVHDVPQEAVDEPLAQVPLQSWVPPGQPQPPPWHVVPPVQALSHAPQLASSLLRSTQAPLHGLGKSAAH